MDKSNLLNFIKKYHLNGCIEKVIIESDSTKQCLSTSFLSEDKHILGFVKANNLDIGDHSLGILLTSKFKTMLNVLGDTITVSPNIIDGDAKSLSLSDSNYNASYMLAHESVFSDVPDPIDNLPDFNVVVNIDKDFINRFKSATSALPEADAFTFVMDKKSGKLQLVIGYSSTLNTDRIVLNIDCEAGKDKVNQVVSFSANYFKEVLKANDECDSAKFNVSDEGIAYIEFNTPEYESLYYFTELDLDGN